MRAHFDSARETSRTAQYGDVSHPKQIVDHRFVVQRVFAGAVGLIVVVLRNGKNLPAST